MVSVNILALIDETPDRALKLVAESAQKVMGSVM